MLDNILVGVDGRQGGGDAVSLAMQLVADARALTPETSATYKGGQDAAIAATA